MSSPPPRARSPAARAIPGYLYSDLASLYERAGMIKGEDGLGDADSHPHYAQRRHHPPHPRPDRLHHRGTDRAGPRDLDQTGVYPPISVLPSLSRLMKDGIGEGYTRADHSAAVQPALRLLLQGEGRPEPGQRHRRGRALAIPTRSTWPSARLLRRYFVHQGDGREPHHGADAWTWAGSCCSILPRERAGPRGQRH